MNARTFARLALTGILLTGGIVLFLKVNPEYHASVITNTSCEDTDGGRKYDARGTVTFLDRDKNSHYSFNDHCDTEENNPDVLHEYYCDDNIYKDKKYKCPNGCSDGICIDSKELFNALDINHDTKINVGEAMTIVSRMYGTLGKRSSDSGFNASFDKNNDGAVTSEDSDIYLNAARQVLSMHDKAMLQAFLMLDENRDGKLIVSEAGPYVSKIHKQLNKRADERKDLDLNNDGIIDNTDIAIFVDTAHLLLNDDMNKQFDAYVRLDDNHDGKITRSEAQQVIGLMLGHVGKRKGDPDYEAALDADHDGVFGPSDAFVLMHTAEKWQID